MSNESSESRTIAAADSSLRLKAMFVIADWAKIHAISDVFAKEECLISFVSKGDGTASSEITDLLGLGSLEKAVFIGIVQSGQTPRIITNARKMMGAGRTGAGIAFTVPLRGLSSRIFSIFETNARLTTPEENGALDKSQESEKESQKMIGIEIKNELIVAVLNRGNSDAYMAAARKAGAYGGTVINARGISQNVIKKFFKMAVQEEKEIIFILADKGQSIDIMSAVKSDFGIESKAAGVIFSLPVDRVMSLNSLT
ncbi:MAG: P-II family nitrogen regulator [Termitinemataceae bacterium]|nr:MAG: P-II family nitrogen regulator [Termitinemataceae bacterium]